MSDFDKFVKDELNNYLTKNIRVNETDKEKIYATRKKRVNLMYYFSFIFVSVLTLVLVTPMIKDGLPSTDLDSYSFSPKSIKSQEEKTLIEQEEKEEEPEEVEETPDEPATEETPPVETVPEDEPNKTEPETPNQTEEPKEPVTDVEDKPDTEQEPPPEKETAPEKEEKPDDTVEKDSEMHAVVMDLMDKYNYMNSPDGVRHLYDLDYPSEKGMKFYEIKTKQELYQVFSDFITPEASASYWGYLLHEDETGLYMIATEPPPFYLYDFGYTLTKIDTDKYKIVQEVGAIEGLYSNYSLTFEISKIDNKWKITKFE